MAASLASTHLSAHPAITVTSSTIPQEAVLPAPHLIRFVCCVRTLPVSHVPQDILSTEFCVRPAQASLMGVKYAHKAHA